MSEKPTDHILVSIIIPNKNNSSMLQCLLEGLYGITKYKHFEVIIIDNGSNENDTFELYRHYKSLYSNFTVHIRPEPFNFSRMINYGIAKACGDCYLLINNDIEILEPYWLRAMVQCLALGSVGIVGAKLLYSDNTIQHAGVVVGYKGTADHAFKGVGRDEIGPNHCLVQTRDVNCVTAAVMLISKECHSLVGLWDEKNFAVAFNDVDYCLRARAAGLRIIWTPNAELYHHESISRKHMRSIKDWWRFQLEKRALKKIHKTNQFIDNTYYDLLNLNNEN